MTYDLAKKLKDAGFPQKEHRNSFCGNDACATGNRMCDYDPTLLELIVGLGSGRIDIIRPVLGLWEIGAEGWKVSGKTPEEALAELWITVNRQMK